MDSVTKISGNCNHTVADQRTFHAREFLRRIDVEGRGEDGLAVVDSVAAGLSAGKRGANTI